MTVARRRALAVRGMVVALAAAGLPAGACSPGPTAGPGVDDDSGDPLPPVYDWVGRWRGEAIGLDDGTTVREQVELVIAFDGRPECALCVRVRVGDLFDRDSLLIGDPIVVELMYVQDGPGTEHRLRMQRHSTGEGPGTAILGRVEVFAADAPPGAAPVRERDLILTRDAR